MKHLIKLSDQIHSLLFRCHQDRTETIFLVGVVKSVDKEHLSYHRNVERSIPPVPLLASYEARHIDGTTGRNAKIGETGAIPYHLPGSSRLRLIPADS